MLTHPLATLSAHTLQAPLSSLLAFQAETIDSNQMKWLVIFVGVAAISLAIVALFILVAAIGAFIAYRDVSKEVGLLRNQANSLIGKSQTLITELTPQIRQITAKVDNITGHVERLTALVHSKADEISPSITAANETFLHANETARETIRTTSATVQDANEKTRAQLTRVDGMITGALSSVARLGVAIEQGIAKPGREVAGIVAGLRAGLQTFAGASQAFRQRTTPTRPASAPTRSASAPEAYPAASARLRVVEETLRPTYPPKPRNEF